MFRIRTGTVDDLESMYELDILCFAPVFRFSRAAMRRFAYGSNKHTFIAEDENGNMAGFLIVSLHAKYDLAYITTLDVGPACRRQGVARQLIQAAEELAAADPVGSMQLHVHTGNDEALRLYLASGYGEVRREEDFYGSGLDAFMLSKNL